MFEDGKRACGASREGVPKTLIKQIIRKGRQMRLGQVANQISRARVDAREFMVDDQKIKAILEWEKPKTIKGLRSFQ